MSSQSKKNILCKAESIIEEVQNVASELVSCAVCSKLRIHFRRKIDNLIFARLIDRSLQDVYYPNEPISLILGG